MPTLAQDQLDYWNGDVGQRWARNQAALDAAFAPLTEALFETAALKPGARVLDVGCGAGETALRAARIVGPRGQVSAADISAPLLAVARERATREGRGGAPIDWLEADAASDAIPHARFDAIVSRFGVMFFADSARAFANLLGALRSGGRLTFLCWRAYGDNPWVSVPGGIVRALVPDLDPPASDDLCDAPGPFRFADPGLIADVLSRFDDVRITAVDAPLLLGRASDGSAESAAEAAAHFAVRLGPAARWLRERDEETRERAFRAVAQGLVTYAESGVVALHAACWLVSARASGQRP